MVGGLDDSMVAIKVMFGSMGQVQVHNTGAHTYLQGIVIFRIGYVFFHISTIEYYIQHGEDYVN